MPRHLPLFPPVRGKQQKILDKMSAKHHNIHVNGTRLTVNNVDLKHKYYAHENS
jgi:hypothetical protein